jgi:glycosyltransferase involved in cell wall biosynthesis
MKLKFVAPVRWSSGYSDMSRRFIYGLQKYSDWEMTIDLVCPEYKTDFGELGKSVDKLVNLKLDHDALIFFFPPENYFLHQRRDDKVNIIFTMFETDRVNKDWVEMCNKADAVLVPSTWNVKLFKDSGVKVPVYYVPTPFIREGSKKDAQGLAGVESSDYMFYSIMQWGERKNPSGLIHAYLSAFSGIHDVVLYLKAHVNLDSEIDRALVEAKVAEARGQIILYHYPKIVVQAGRTLSHEEMENIHKRGDCFVSPHRGEGFGLPIFDAMTFGNPVITTDGTGNADFTKPFNSFLLKATKRPIFNMERWNAIYDSTMNFLDPDINQLKEQMFRAYSHKEFAKEIGKKGQEYILENFSLEKTTQIFKDTVEKIVRDK